MFSRYVFVLALVVATPNWSWAQAPDTLKQESYGLFALGDSTVDGVVQVRETPAGSAEFVITLNGLVPGDLHAAALYEGNCAPDQPLVAELETVGDSVPEDPFASITALDLPYSAVVTGDYFVTVYGTTLDTPTLACGEVGVGANRSDLGATSSPEGAAMNNPADLSQPERLVARAKTLVETETGVAADSLTLDSSEAVEWNDASLGCPQPGMMYAQVVTPGHQIKLTGPNGETYDVHTGAAPDDKVLLCTQSEGSKTPQRTNANVTQITGTVWQWQTDRLEDSSNYTVEFLSDDTLAFQADCNRGRAHFETFGENGLRVDAPATTRAACPPGSLELGAGVMTFMRVGAQEIVIPMPTPEVDAARTTYHAVTAAHDLHVVIEKSTCTDTMNSFPYEATVTVTLDGETFQGCGESL